VQLIKLLQKDGWTVGKTGTHGVSLTKAVSLRTLVTIIPTSKQSLPTGTLQAILNSKQTGLGKTGLLSLLNTYGL